MTNRDKHAQVSSRIIGFYREPLSERVAHILDSGLLSPESREWLKNGGGLEPSIADRMSENVIGTMGLPLCVGLNFRINHQDHLIPMATEEPSVVAAASNAARMVRASGGFTGTAAAPVMTAQVQFDEVPEPWTAPERIQAIRTQVLAQGNAAIPRMVERGGGCRDVEVRVIDPDDGLVVVHVFIDVGNAMGANMVDTVAEAVAPMLHRELGGRLGLRILSNVPLKRMVTVSCQVSTEALGGSDIAEGIVRASRFAERDPLRAATHNKGVLNGVDAVAIALGQDWRAIEASAHAFAALQQDGYRPLARWRYAGENLMGELSMPLAVGTVGGATQTHPGVRAAFEMLCVDSAGELAVVMASVGLATNLAALRALAGEGIQRGHMRLHSRRLSTQTDS